MKDPAEAAIYTMSLSGIDCAFTEPGKPSPTFMANTPNAVLKIFIFYPPLIFLNLRKTCISNRGAKRRSNGFMGVFTSVFGVMDPWAKKSRADDETANRLSTVSRLYQLRQ